MKHVFDSAIAIIGTGAAFLFGGWDANLIILVCFIAADYITGVALAIANRKLSSAVGFKGLAKKACIMLVVMLAVMLDRLINDGAWIFRTLSAYFYIANEGISILENSAQLGVPIPQKLKKVLAQLSKDGSNDQAETPQ